ncbi:phasin family protein [Bradyrhizobium sp. AZCC 1693]|uniref:phasin family protein n=1 Tax=Bradyrhizobium sp. AZCC 1693 TaxID=3117029 RepID=UPI002FF12039
MSESETKTTLNASNGPAMPLFGFPKIALAGVFSELAEQGVARAQEGCEKIKAASENMAEALRETYSSNARSANDYGLKVIEIANANTVSAIDFFAHLLGSKSVTDALTLSAAQARKTFDTTSAQNKELWELAQKLAAETGEPIRKHAAKVLHQAN